MMLSRALKATLTGFLFVTIVGPFCLTPREADEAALTAGSAPQASQGSAGPVEANSQLPLFFLPNRGQADARARFIARAGGQTAYLTDDGIVFDSTFVEKERRQRRVADPTGQDGKKGKRLVWGLDFEGADPKPRISGELPAEAKFHYLIGDDPSKWITDVPSYQAVVYHDLYPGIDLKLYGKGGRMEYDLIVRPGADLNKISLACRGLEKLAVRDGELVAPTEVGEIRQTRPNIYQESNGAREEVGGGFKLLADNRYSFTVGEFNASLPLVIDPALITLPYSTFLGGASDDRGKDIGESGGFLFVCGDTYSSDFPVTTGAYDTVYNNREAFVAKLDPGQTGASSLVWCTFLGGSEGEDGNGIYADNSGPFVCGTSYSDDFPLVNNGSLVNAGGNDGFVARLNSSGNGLLFSVLIGGDAWEWCHDIDVSGSSIWVCGVVTTGDYFYPTAVDRKSYGHTASPSYGDSFILQLTNTTPVSRGQVVVLGGSAADEVQAIAVDAMNVYVVGHTASADFVTTPGAYDTSHSSGPSYNTDVFAVKLDYAGNMTYSTFFGNSEEVDYGWGIDVNTLGNAFICGETYGDIPVINGYDSSRSHSYSSSGFMAKLNSSGSNVDYSTYIETDDFGGVTAAYDIRVGQNYDCWVTGSSWLQLSGISAKNYYQLMQGYDDAFVVRIDTLATGLDSLVFGTHLGAGRDGADTGHEFGRGVVGSWNHAYLTGYTNSPGFPAVNAFQSALDGGEDAFVAHLVEPMPAVTTDAANLVYSSSANLNGTVTSKSGAAYLNARFEWGTTSGAPYASTTSPSESVSSAPTSYSKTLNGLAPGATYYYRAVGYHYLYDYVYGAERSFTTQAALEPTVTTAGPSNITGTTAQCGGDVTSGGSDPVLERGVCWNTGGSPTTADSHTSDGAGTGTFTSSITGLTPNTTYWVRAYATNAVGTSYGSQVSFTTDNTPTVTTAAVTSITGSTASSGGNVTVDGGDPVTARGVCWNTTGSPTTANSHTIDGSGTGSFTSSLTGLSPNTTYYVRAYATNGVGTAYGGQETFTTDDYPTVTTAAVTNITGSTATGGGNVTSDGGELVYERGVCWNTSGNPTTAGAHTTETGGTGSFDSNMTGLTPGTMYYVRAYATNSVGTSYGGQETFTTDTAPTVTTAAVSNITGSSADSGGNVTSDGGESVTARGVCWNTTGSPTTADSSTSNGTGTGAFTSSLTGLTPGTTYYVRAYATNSVGTAYGGQETFTTDTVPTVTTTAVTNVTSSSADSGGNVTSDGGESVTARGVCWNTTGSPTTADSSTSNGTGTGAFASSLSGLTPGATYHVRAYATNSVGTAYGGQETFTALPETPVAQPATSIGATSFQANWNAAAGATGYRLDVALDGAFTNILPAYNNLDAGNVTAYSVTGLSSGTQYYYRLRAYNAGGTTANSNVIGVTTLAVHTVTFAAGPDGTLSGNLYQTVVHGSDCTPVTAVPNTGFRFIDWSGPGGFWSAANPLTVADVQSDMDITARFANLAPTIRIVNPADGAGVWGSVLIQAEASDDSGIRSVDFFVDGLPLPASGQLSQSPGEAAAGYSRVWSSLGYANGPHVIKATAVDATGATSTDQITVNLQNVAITLTGQRLEDRAWIIRREFVRLNLTALNTGGAPVARYIITRRTGGGAEEMIAAVDAADLQGGVYEYNDATLPEGATCVYRVRAVTAADMVVGLSNEVTL
ncbi:MAG: hypothetical protein A2Y86_00420 [Candidatus Aminicenantes bacterium RBG_13_62_12]|nr:MAG: hypothetical protein A2Y86_00420 [Candidatus Aminicenantes bacterium RBG_13_62_12]